MRFDPRRLLRERPNFLAAKAGCPVVKEKAMDFNQLGAADGALRQAAELAQLVWKCGDQAAC